MGSEQSFNWRFAGEPSLTNVIAGVGDVSVQLEGVLYGEVKGPPAWAQQLSTTAGVEYQYGNEQVVTDTKGNVYHVIAVKINNIYSYVASKFSKSGTLVWSKHYNKVSGFGNQLSKAYNYSWSVRVGPQGLIIVASQNGSVTSSNLSGCNKVICISTGSGTVRWAKAVTSVEGNYVGFVYGHLFASVHVNDKTGHTYIVSQLSGYSQPNGFNVITLDSFGEVTGNITTDFYNSNILTMDGGNCLADGSMVIVGSYLRPVPGTINDYRRGGYYLILTASGSVQQTLRLVGEDLNESAACTFQSRPLATILSSGNIVWTGTNGIVEFNSNMSSVVSYQGLKDVHDISERSDGSFAVISQQVVSTIPEWAQLSPYVWCTASLKILNSSRSQITSIKELGLGEQPSVLDLLDGCTSKVDRFTFVAQNTKTLISIDLSINYWRTQVSPLGYLKIMTRTANLPISIPSLTLPAITNPNFSTSTTGTIISDYTGSVTVETPTDTWTFYSSTS
jgi:hypothetical protein